jgi:histidinol dehydrogenase
MLLSPITLADFRQEQSNSELFDETILNQVKAILSDVKRDGDQAVRDFTRRFDHAELIRFRVSEQEMEDAWNRVDDALKTDLSTAYQNIIAFHERQRPKDYSYELFPGSTVGQRIVPIDAVGIYVPGGTAAYPSTVLMNAAPAQVAGVPRIVMVSPPDKNGGIADVILAAARIAGVTELYKVGGAQAVAALAYGTQTIPKVDQIVGPGNIYVALAKRELYGIVGIDMVAGPSEILIVADETANPAFVAADLLSQAEHDTLARPLLVTTDASLIDKVNQELEQQLAVLPRRDMARISLQNEGRAILVDSRDEAIEAANLIAPEHLELLVTDPDAMMTNIRNAGAIFVGPYSPEPLGDYIAGPNHTLPTSGTARFASALSTTDFLKKISVIRFDRDGLSRYQDAIVNIATEEGLTAHANAVSRRFQDED